MPTGLLVINDSGNIQIDQTYRNYELRAKDTVTANIFLGGNIAAYFAQFSIAGLTAPILAFRGDGAGGRCYTQISHSVSSGVWTFRILTGAPGGAGSGDIDYWIYDVPVSSGQNAGMQIFNSAAQLVFDSGRKYLRVVDSFAFDASQIGTGSQTKTYPAGRDYAFVTARLDFDILSGGEYQTYGLRPVGSDIGVNTLLLHLGSPQAEVLGEARFLIIDVTDH
jgi:hypothetical protein